MAFREGDRTGAGPGRQRLRPAFFPRRCRASSRDKKAVLRRPPLRSGRGRERPRCTPDPPPLFAAHEGRERRGPEPEHPR